MLKIHKLVACGCRGLKPGSFFFNQNRSRIIFRSSSTIAKRRRKNSIEKWHQLSHGKVGEFSNFIIIFFRGTQYPECLIADPEIIYWRFLRRTVFYFQDTKAEKIKKDD